MSWGIGKLLRPVKSSQRLVELLACEIDENSGSPQLLSGSLDFSIADNGTGDYTLSFIREQPQRILAVSVQSKTADAIAQVVYTAGTPSSGIQILGFDATDGTTAKEIDCSVLVVVSHAADEV